MIVTKSDIRSKRRCLLGDG